ncbi:MAG: HPr family phosphocarrier protein [Gammaproteobacteria bacterium]
MESSTAVQHALHKTVTIINKLGLHARAAAKLVACCSRFASELTIKKGEQQINAKSIMGVMMLAASQGTELELFVTGEDAHEMLAAVEQLIADKFGESE